MVFASSCKKYEEGPTLSFRSAKSRIEGKWKVTSFIRDNKEQMNVWDYDNYHIMRCKATGKEIGIGGPGIERNALTEIIYEYKSSGSRTNERKIRYEKIDYAETEKQCKGIWLHDYTSESKSETTWELDKNKENIVIKDGSSIYKFEIIMLKEKKMKLRMVQFNNTIDEYILEKL